MKDSKSSNSKSSSEPNSSLGSYSKKMDKKLKTSDKKEHKFEKKIDEKGKLRTKDRKDRFVFPMWTIGVVVLLLALTNFTYLNQLESKPTKSLIVEAEKYVNDVERECKDALSQIVEDVYRSVEQEKNREDEANIRFSQFLTKDYPTTRGSFAIELSKPKIEVKNAYYTSYDVEQYNRTKVMMPVYVTTEGKVHVAVVSAKFNYERDIDLDVVVSTCKPLIENRISKYVRNVEGRMQEIFEDMLNSVSEYITLDREIITDALELSMAFEECCVFHATTNKELSDYLNSLNRIELSRISPAQYFLSRYGYNVNKEKNETGKIVLDLSSYGEPFYFTSEKYVATMHSIMPKREVILEPRIEIEAKSKIEKLSEAWKCGILYDVKVSGGVFNLCAYGGNDSGKTVFELNYEYSKFVIQESQELQISNLSNVLGFYCEPTNESITEARELGGQGSFVLLDVPEGATELAWIDTLTICAEKEVVPVLRIRESNVTKIGIFVSNLISSGAWDFARFRYIQIAGLGNYTSLLLGAAQRLKVLPGVRILGKEFSGIEEIESLITNLSMRGLAIHDLIDIWASRIPEGHPYQSANYYYEEMRLLDKHYPNFGYLSGKMPVMITSMPFDKNTSMLYLYCNTTENPDGRFVSWRPWMIEDRVCIISAFFPLEGNEGELHFIKENLPEVERNENACGGWTEKPSAREVEPATPCMLIIKSFTADKVHANIGEVIKIKITVENIGRIGCVGKEKDSFEYPYIEDEMQNIEYGICIGSYTLGNEVSKKPGDRILFSSGLNLLPGERKEVVINARFKEDISCELYASARYGFGVYEYEKYIRIEVSNTTPSAKVRIESLAWSETSPVVNEIVSLKVSVRNIGSAVAYTQSGEEEVQTYPRVSIWPGIPGRYRIALVGMRSELRYSLGNDIGAGERSVVELKVSFSEKLEDMISVRIIEEGLGYVDTRPASEISVIEIGEYRNSITYGQGISATYNSRKDSSVCLPGCYQPAYAYYGIRDRVEFVKENGNLYANLDEPGKVVEYKMLIGGEISELKIYGLGQGLENGSAEAVSEVKANVYVDGIKRGEVILSEKDENVHERIINLTIPYCEHYVALECAGSYEGKGFRLVGLSTILKTSFRVDYRVYYTANKSYVKILASNITQGFVAYSEMSKIRISKIWLGSETNNPQIEILDVSMKEIAILNGVKKNDWLEFDISNIGLVEGLRYYIRIVLDKPIEYEFSYDIYPLGDAIIDGKEYYYLDAFIEVC